MSIIIITQVALFVVFVVLVSLFFAAQFTKMIRKMSPTAKVFLPGAIFAAVQIIAAIFF
jgi:hypothetical protein